MPTEQAGTVVKEKGQMLARAVEFLKESKNELGKVIFPSRQELIGSTTVVVVSVIVVSLFLFLVDTGLSQLMAYLVSR